MYLLWYVTECLVSFSWDIFQNFAVIALFEVPGILLSYVGISYVGRRLTLSASLLMSGASCFLSSLMMKYWATGRIGFFLLGKLCASSAFGTNYLYNTELFPTTKRNVVLGLCSMIGRLGAIASPYVIRLDVLTGIDLLPMSVFAVAGIISAVLTMLFLPETRGKPLPRTLTEAVDMS